MKSRGHRGALVPLLAQGFHAEFSDDAVDAQAIVVEADRAVSCIEQAFKNWNVT